jgi:hypothetical protein
VHYNSCKLINVDKWLMHDPICSVGSLKQSCVSSYEIYVKNDIHSLDIVTK